MTWCLYFLTKHPEVQEKVFDELDKVLGDEEDIKPQVASELTWGYIIIIIITPPPPALSTTLISYAIIKAIIISIK